MQCNAVMTSSCAVSLERRKWKMVHRGLYTERCKPISSQPATRTAGHEPALKIEHAIQQRDCERHHHSAHDDAPGEGASVRPADFPSVRPAHVLEHTNRCLHTHKQRKSLIKDVVLREDLTYLSSCLPSAVVQDRSRAEQRGGRKRTSLFLSLLLAATMLLLCWPCCTAAPLFRSTEVQFRPAMVRLRASTLYCVCVCVCRACLPCVCLHVHTCICICVRASTLSISSLC